MIVSSFYVNPLLGSEAEDNRNQTDTGNSADAVCITSYLITSDKRVSY